MTPPSAQRLSASYMLELGHLDLGASGWGVLNAFRHLICWNVDLRAAEPGRQRAQRLSASYMLELAGCGDEEGAVGVLNAFRHLICWNDVILHIRRYGQNVLNAFRHLICWNPELALLWGFGQRVLNAFRHLICWNISTSVHTWTDSLCSTPFGILYVGTRSLGRMARHTGVLNAFRHLICWNRPRVSGWFR